MIIFKFEPIYKQRVWGGVSLRTKFNRNLKLTGQKIGESWEIVDREDAMSVVSSGKWKGKSLRSIIFENSSFIMGPNWDKDKRFPILVKWLDCQERLSLQVHPPEKIAHQLKGEPKTENWYVVDAIEDAGLFVGLKKKIDKPTFKKAIREEKVEGICHRLKSQPGDSILVESGRLHAIDGGNLILEIQQNSDTTYRVYDWGRVGINQKPRDLHLEKSLKCIDFNDIKPSTIKSKGITEIVLADCKHFRIVKLKMGNRKEKLLKLKNIDCAIVHVISGTIKIGCNKVIAGEQVISPFSSKCLIKSLENSTLLITDSFSK
jgi:mannose-6-phosphate isomerase